MTKGATNNVAIVDNWTGDVLGRKRVADDFTGILKTLPTPHVVSINAGYGMGKSFFVDRWRLDLKRAGHTVLFFNAWENDFSNDPLMAFVVDLKGQVDATGITKAKSAVMGVVESVGRIGYQAMKSASEAATLGLVDLDKIHEAEATADLKKAYGDFAQERVEAHLDVRRGIASFKEGLSGIAAAIAEKNGKGSLPIVVFIDELDRCRPSFQSFK